MLEKTENRDFYYIRKLTNIQDRLLLIKQRRTFTKEDFKVLEENTNIVLILLKQIYFKN